MKKTSIRTDDGQDLVEYGLLASLIAAVVLAAVNAVGAAAARLWSSIALGMPR